MLTELWWGIASYGKWGTATERSCAGGGFASCLPSRLRQLGWSVVGSMAGINSVNLYTQVRVVATPFRVIQLRFYMCLALLCRMIFC